MESIVLQGKFADFLDLRKLHFLNNVLESLKGQRDTELSLFAEWGAFFFL